MSHNGRDPSGESSSGADDSWETVLLDPGIDRILDNLCDRYRRLILLRLKEGAIEREDDVLRQELYDRERRKQELIHHHLPRLQDVGYVEWDRQTGKLSKGPRFDEVEPFFELLEEHASELPADWP